MHRPAMPKKVRFAFLMAVLAAVASLAAMTSGTSITPVPAFAAAPGAVVVYQSIPSPQPGNVPSEGPEAYAFKELGSQITLAGTARQSPTVTVLLSSWGCQTGSWNLHTCATTPGATFTVPITVRLYNVGPSNTVGAAIGTPLTQTFSVPYRPSADNVHCTGPDLGKWFNGTACFNGIASPISFDLSGVTLPTNVIVSFSYNSTHYGYAPIGESASCYSSSGGCAYDSLNLGFSQVPATVGSNPLPNGMYQNSSIGGEYCDNGAGGTSIFRKDDGCWAPYQLAVKVEAVTSIQALRNAVNSSGAASASRLDTYLRSAQSYLALGTPTMKAAACEQLKLFKSAVTTAMRTDPVVAVQGPGWIIQADAIRAGIPCVAPN